MVAKRPPLNNLRCTALAAVGPVRPKATPAGAKAGTSCAAVGASRTAVTLSPAAAGPLRPAATLTTPSMRREPSPLKNSGRSGRFNPANRKRCRLGGSSTAMSTSPRRTGPVPPRTLLRDVVFRPKFPGPPRTTTAAGFAASSPRSDLLLDAVKARQLLASVLTLDSGESADWPSARATTHWP